MDSIEKVINLYLTECSGGNLGSRHDDYREAENELMEQLAEMPDNAEMQMSIMDLLALTEQLAFRDGFAAGVKHMQELSTLANE